MAGNGRPVCIASNSRSSGVRPPPQTPLGSRRWMASAAQFARTLHDRHSRWHSFTIRGSSQYQSRSSRPRQRARSCQPRARVSAATATGRSCAPIPGNSSSGGVCRPRYSPSATSFERTAAPANLELRSANLVKCAFRAVTEHGANRGRYRHRRSSLRRCDSGSRGLAVRRLRR